MEQTYASEAGQVRHKVQVNKVGVKHLKVSQERLYTHLHITRQSDPKNNAVRYHCFCAQVET